MAGDDFRITISYRPRETTVACCGELDVLTVPKLRDALALVVDTDPRSLRIDGRGITLLSSIGIDALIDAAAHAIARDIAVEIELSPGGRRIADLAGAWWVGRVEDPYPGGTRMPSSAATSSGAARPERGPS